MILRTPNPFAKERIRHFARSVLNAEAWFQTANQLIAAMDLLEPHVERFWDDFRSLVFVVDQASDTPSKQQTSDPPSKHNLTNEHMMLAGFAIENLSKGYLASRSSHEEQQAVQAGVLPKFLKSHNLKACGADRNDTVRHSEISAK
jgi:hypothetical protein